MLDQRILNEIEHGRKIVGQAGEIWGWETPAGKVRWMRRVKLLTSHITPYSKVLEIGCGTGYFTRELLKTGADILAIDISPDLLSKARNNINTSNVEFRQENAYELSSIPDDSFDAVMGSSVLHHLEVDRVLAQFHRVLKTKGTLTSPSPIC